MSSTSMDRVERLVRAARRIADPSDPLGIEARKRLPAATGLSMAGVELALAECLETHPGQAEISALCAGVEPAPRAHVLLSANVFVAAHRAIALAVASSPNVVVRPSRREPEMARLLFRADERLFELADRLEPKPGEHLWAYGSDESLERIRASTPDGVVLHAHGTGIGVAVVDVAHADPRGVARRLARDVIAFDQRGCLSPRVLFAVGSERETRALGAAVARALSEGAESIPIGSVSDDEAADAVRYRDAMTYAAEILEAGPGWVGLDTSGERVVVAPVGRNVHVVRARDLSRALAPIKALVSAIGVEGPARLRAHLAELVPGARLSAIGRMQRPPFDGPVDRRAAALAGAPDDC